MATISAPKSVTRARSGSNGSAGRGTSRIKAAQDGKGSPRHSHQSQISKHIVGNYLLQKKLGVGTFGEVRLAIHIPTGEKVAVKILEKSRVREQADIRRVNREIKILKKARHGNIIQLYEVLDTPSAIYLMMENAEGGEMFDYIVAHRKLCESEACQFFHQILEGVDALHKLDITHRDLKPENLLLKAAPEGWIIKIVDFGLSNTHEGGRFLSTACGSPCYAAPEMIAGRSYSGPLADTWSMGIILFALVCGYLPFEDANTANLYKKILSGDYKAPRWLSSEVRNLLSRILETEPTKRYSLQDIRRHVWYSSVKDEDIPIETSTEAECDRCHTEILRAMDEQGVDVQTVQDDLASRSCNTVTATYYLLQQRYRTARAVRGGGGGGGGGDSVGQNYDQKSKHLPNMSKENDKDKHSEKSQSRHRVERMEFHGACDEEQMGEEMKEEAKEREETIIITLPKNYQAINGPGQTSKAAMNVGMGRVRKENNGTLSLSAKGSNAIAAAPAAASGSISTGVCCDKTVAHAIVSTNTIMSANASTRATTTQSSFSGQENSVSVNGTAHVQTHAQQAKAPSTKINIIPSYLSLRAKEGKATPSDTPSSSSSSSSSAHAVEHVMRRPDLQPPSFAVRRSRPVPAIAKTGASVSSAVTPAMVTGTGTGTGTAPALRDKERDRDRDVDRDRGSEKEKEKEKDNGGIRQSSATNSPAKERVGSKRKDRDKEKEKDKEKSREKEKKKDGGDKTGALRASMVVGVKSVYSVAGVFAAARQLTSSSKKSPVPSPTSSISIPDSKHSKVPLRAALSPSDAEDSRVGQDVTVAGAKKAVLVASVLSSSSAKACAPAPKTLSSLISRLAINQKISGTVKEDPDATSSAQSTSLMLAIDSDAETKVSKGERDRDRGTAKDSTPGSPGDSSLESGAALSDNGDEKYVPSAVTVAALEELEDSIGTGIDGVEDDARVAGVKENARQCMAADAIEEEPPLPRLTAVPPLPIDCSRDISNSEDQQAESMQHKGQEPGSAGRGRGRGRGRPTTRRVSLGSSLPTSTEKDKGPPTFSAASPTRTRPVGVTRIMPATLASALTTSAAHVKSVRAEIEVRVGRDGLALQPPPPSSSSSRPGVRRGHRSSTAEIARIEIRSPTKSTLYTSESSTNKNDDEDGLQNSENRSSDANADCGSAAQRNSDSECETAVSPVISEMKMKIHSEEGRAKRRRNTQHNSVISTASFTPRGKAVPAPAGPSEHAPNRATAHADAREAKGVAIAAVDSIRASTGDVEDSNSDDSLFRSVDPQEDLNWGERGVRFDVHDQDKGQTFTVGGGGDDDYGASSSDSDSDTMSRARSESTEQTDITESTQSRELVPEPARARAPENTHIARPPPLRPTPPSPSSKPQGPGSPLTSAVIDANSSSSSRGRGRRLSAQSVPFPSAPRIHDKQS